MRIVIAGGGYAGLACLIELRRRVRDAELILIDPGQEHFKVTHLHETVRRPLSHFQTSYAQLAERYRFEHYYGAIANVDLASIAQDSRIDVGSHALAFDYLVIATGGAPPPLAKNGHAYDRDDLREQNAGELVSAFLADKTRPRQVTVVGGGPSGIQILFELLARFAATREQIKLRLVDREPILLAEYPAGIRDYLLEKLAESGVEYLPETEYLNCTDDTIELRNIATAVEHIVPSGLHFLFPGVMPSPIAVQADRYGRIDGYDNILGAGDCAQFNSRGDDLLTAQVAVRQGKLVAQNIDRLSRNVRPFEYFFRELGYVVSLGPLDAVGWLLLKDNVVHGLPAFAIKELVEVQYDLLVAGLDTYIV